MSNGLSDNYGAEIGMRVTCMRCGTQKFRKQTGYNTVDAAIANRHSFLDQFEKMPDGWKIRHEAGGWLCPQCNEYFDRVVQEYMTSVQKFMEGGENNENAKWLNKTIDAVPVVRCKDCRHLTVYNSPTLYAYCQKTHLRFEPFKEDTRTHFCSYGERKDNG